MYHLINRQECDPHARRSTSNACGCLARQPDGRESLGLGIEPHQRIGAPVADPQFVLTVEIHGIRWGLLPGIFQLRVATRNDRGADARSKAVSGAHYLRRRRRHAETQRKLAVATCIPPPEKTAPRVQSRADFRNGFWRLSRAGARSKKPPEYRPFFSRSANDIRPRSVSANVHRAGKISRPSHGPCFESQRARIRGPRPSQAICAGATVRPEIPSG